MITRRSRHNRKSERGSGLLIALCLAAVFTICLGSFITLSYTSLYVSNRNLANAHAVELAEAGMEQALWSINNSTWTGWTQTASSSTLTTSGFNYSSGSSGKFTLTVANWATTAPTITSVATVTLSDGTILTHTASSPAGPVPTFVNAVGALNGKVKFQYGGTVDSYNSTLGTYASQTPGTSAIILSSDASTTTVPVALGTSTVKGYVVTQTGSANPTTSSATITASNVTTEQNPDLPVFNESSVGTGTNLNLSGNTTIGSPTASVATTYYVNGDLDLSNTILYINGPVVLNVSGNISISGTGGIVIEATTNTAGQYVASLELHVQGALSLGGNGVSNLTLSPLRLAIIDTQDQNTYDTTYNIAANTDTVSTTTAFYGVLYFPYDTLTISSNITVYGAVVANTVKLTGSSPTIHYDMALRTPSTAITSAAYTAISTPTAITSWTQTN